MTQELPLPRTNGSDEPIYNMKAVTQRTGIPAATLRAWERRYKVLEPRRSAGNYRLYSERELETLIWLKSQLDAGLSISRAIALLDRQRDALPVQLGHAHPALADEGQAENWDRLRRWLGAALVNLDEQEAGAALAEAFALYTVEDVCVRLIGPCLFDIGEAWHSGRISVATEHFATAYLMGRLMALLNAQPPGQGPLVLVGCAPGERHEVGALMLALRLRRKGRNVRYLGADVPAADLARAIRELRPRAVALSATLAESAERLADLRPLLGSLASSTRFVFGGQAFAGNGLAQRLDFATIVKDDSDSVGAVERAL